jgi:hypothetical protein
MNMHRALPLLAALSFLVGCAQTGPNENRTPMPKTVDLKSCGARVTFSGPPERPSRDLMQAFSEFLGPYHRWESDMWWFRQYGLIEMAFCACRDSSFTVEEVALDLSLGVGGFSITERDIKVPGFRSLTELEKNTSGEVQIVRVGISETAPKCMLAQMVRSRGSDRGMVKPFFAALEVQGASGSEPSPGKSAGSASDRLRQLDQLLKEGLISRDEYDSRRRRVLDSL